MFRQNNAIVREWLCSFLSHFSVHVVGDKSEYNHQVQVYPAEATKNVFRLVSYHKPEAEVHSGQFADAP
jgi:hypothetical protein